MDSSNFLVSTCSYGTVEYFRVRAVCAAWCLFLGRVYTEVHKVVEFVSRFDCAPVSHGLRFQAISTPSSIRLITSSPSGP